MICQLCGFPLHVHTSTRLDGSAIDLAECVNRKCDLFRVTENAERFPLSESAVNVYAGLYRRIEAMRHGKCEVRV